MKLSIIAACLVMSATAQATVIFDDFSGSIIDTGIWTVTTPFGDSSVSASGGHAVLNNGGELLSTPTLPTNFDLTGRFAFTGSAFDHFRIVMFTNGVQSLASGEVNGLTLQFGIQSDTGNTANNINIEEANFPTGSPAIGAATVPISLSTFYDFELAKIGNQISVYFNDNPTPIITTTSTYITVGSYLDLHDRADNGSSINAGSQVQLDYVSVTNIPEPAAIQLILSFTIFAFCIFRRNRAPYTIV